MIWQFIHYPAGDAPSRDCEVRAPSLHAARRKLARALSVVKRVGSPPIGALNGCFGFSRYGLDAKSTIPYVSSIGRAHHEPIHNLPSFPRSGSLH